MKKEREVGRESGGQEKSRIRTENFTPVGLSRDRLRLTKKKTSENKKNQKKD